MKFMGVSINCGGVMLALLVIGFSHSGLAFEGVILDLDEQLHDEVSRGQYASYEAMLIAASTNQLDDILAKGSSKNGESFKTLINQRLVRESVDEVTQFHNFAQTVTIPEKDNLLNVLVQPQTISATSASLHDFIKKSMFSYVSRSNQLQVVVTIPINIWPVEVELKGSKITLRDALNRIGRTLTCGWSSIGFYTPEKGYYLDVDFIALPRRGYLPLAKPPEGTLPRTDLEFLIQTAKTGKPNERRLAVAELTRWISSDDEMLKKVKDLALDILQGSDVQLRRDISNLLPFIFKYSDEQREDDATSLFPEKANEISRIRESKDITYLFRLIKEGDACEKGIACERLSMGIVNSRQFSSLQIDDIRKEFISLLMDKNVFVRRKSGDALEMIIGLDIK